MKIFLDTNIFVEYIEERQEVETVAEILETIADGKHQGILLSGRVLHIDLPAGKGFKAQRHPQAHIDGLASQSIGGHSIHRYSCRHFSRASS